jgi:hypothetical protein
MNATAKRPPPLSTLFRFVGLSLAVAAFALATDRLAGRGLGLFGACAFLLACHAWRTYVGRGAAVARALGRERLELNLRAAGVRETPLVFPYKARGLVLAVCAAAFLGAGLRDDAEALGRRASHALRKETPSLRVEYPSYTETPSLETDLGDDADAPPALEVDAASYLEFFLRNRKRDTDWKLEVEVEVVGESQPTPPTPLARDLPPAGQLGLSAAALLEALGLPRDFEGTRSLRVKLSRSDGSQARHLRLDVLPVPRPVVRIEPTDGSGDGGETDEDARIRLTVRVDSRVPLSLVELQIRTTSGYRLNKTVGEFANARELTFETDKAEIGLLGIPFKAPDSLFVKAVAKTVVAGLEGHSRELEFRVRTRQEARQDLQKLLQGAKEDLANIPDVNAARDAVRSKLQEAQAKAPELGRRHPVVRQTREALDALERMRAKGDENAMEVAKRIDAALESLKREQAADETSSLLARMQNLRNSVTRQPEGEAPGASEAREALSKEARSLGDEAQALKEQLAQLVEGDGASGLSLEEKQDAKDLLSRDRTSDRLQGTSDALEAGDKPEANAQAQGALDEASKGLGQVMQMMQAARQRAMRQAREKLTDADAKLQEARESQARGENGREPLGEAGKSLGQTPRLSQEFNEAVNEARQQQRDAQLQSGKDPGQSGEHVDKAQDAIVKALTALQEEEAAEEQQRREQDGRMSRSAMDALSAQGQLDVGWRKRILEEIARLKAAGETADSPVIRYLESRLR